MILSANLIMALVVNNILIDTFAFALDWKNSNDMYHQGSSRPDPVNIIFM